MKRVALTGFVLVAAVAILSAGLTTASAGAVSQKQIKKNLAALYKKAKREGQVNFLGAGDPSTFYTKTVAAFQKKYPGITVKVGGQTTQTTANLVTEAAAGKVSTDVVACEVGDIQPLISRKLIVSYKWNKISNITPSSFIYNGRFSVLGDNVGMFVYNKNALKSADIPKSFFKFIVASKFADGKVGVSTTGRWAAWLYPMYKKNFGAANEDIKAMMALKPLVVTSGTQNLNAVANGQIQIGWVPGPTALNAIAQGAPIAVAPFTPSYGLPTGTFVMKKAPHPNAALLFQAFLVDRKTRKTLLSDPFFSFATEGKLASTLKRAGIKFVRLTKPNDISAFLSLASVAASATTSK